VAPLGLWLTLDAGTFETVEINGDSVRVTLAPATPFTPQARLRVEQPAAMSGVTAVATAERFNFERGAYVIPLAETTTQVVLTQVR